MSRNNERFKAHDNRPIDGLVGRWLGPTGSTGRVYKYSLIGAGKERKMRIFIDSYIWHDDCA